jgi:hypothetical protein
MQLWESGRLLLTAYSRKVSLNPCITASVMAGIAAYGLMVIVIRRHVNRPEIGNVGCLGQGGARLRIEAKHVVRSLDSTTSRTGIMAHALFESPLPRFGLMVIESEATPLRGRLAVASLAN